MTQGKHSSARTKIDGRKLRWHRHRVDRRNELVDSTIAALRTHGQFGSMDEIAYAIGVSKTVLYRYFIDKNDLTTAVILRFAHTTLIPNIAKAVSSDLEGFALVHEITRVYVQTVAGNPEPYRFLMTHSSSSKNKVIADAERIIARMVALMLRQRMTAAGLDTRGVEPWTYMTVGGVQLATHSWLLDPHMSMEELIDYMAMLNWSALCGIVEVGGSLQTFQASPHPAPQPRWIQRTD